MYSSDRKNSHQKTKARKLQNLSVIQVAQNMKELIDNNVEHHVNLDIALPFFKDKNNGYSFMNSFWTLLPKFCASSPQVDKLEFPWIQVGNDSYQVTLIPTVRKNNANSKTSNWPLKAVFPNLREMYVEEALTKFAVCDFRHGLGACEIELEDLSKQYLVSVKFTLYDLQKELRERG